MEVAVFCFDAIRSDMATLCSDILWNIEEDREIWFDTSSRKRAQVLDFLERNAPPKTLIGKRRAGKTVADHVATGKERRTDAFCDVLCSGSDHHEKLGARVEHAEVTI